MLMRGPGDGTMAVDMRLYRSRKMRIHSTLPFRVEIWDRDRYRLEDARVQPAGGDRRLLGGVSGEAAGSSVMLCNLSADHSGAGGIENAH